MMKRPRLAKRRRIERLNRGAAQDDLQRGLSDAVGRSISTIATKVEKLVRDKKHQIEIAPNA